MPNSDPLNHANLGLLPDERGRYGSFGVSLAVNAAVLGLAILFSIAGVHEVKKQQISSILIFPTTQPKPIPPPVPRIHVYAPPPKVLLEPPKIQLPKPKPVVEPPKMEEVKMWEEAPRLAPAPPLRVTPPPQPKVGLFSSVHPTLVANNRVRPSTKTGGFGDPNGIRPNPNANRPATIAAVGSFQASPGIGDPGAGAARRGSVHGVDFGSGVVNGVAGGRDTRGTVASAGFSKGVVGGTGKPGGTGRAVEKSGFGGTGFGNAVPARRQQEMAQTTPLVLLSKPRPGYTEEARKMKIQGDVTLQVRFTASGQVEVLRVVSGLGYGLDRLAQSAARRIHFKPATRDGHPVDEVTVIHVTFQLA
ncbi:MAG: energy transducer TonB [Acidobacteriaceae bacterium]